MTQRTVPPVMTAPTHSGPRACDVMTEVAIHTVTLPEGAFACIVGSNPATGKGSIHFLDREEVEAHITFLRNAIEDAERINKGLGPIHSAHSLRRN